MNDTDVQSDTDHIDDQQMDHNQTTGHHHHHSNMKVIFQTKYLVNNFHEPTCSDVLSRWSGGNNSYFSLENRYH